MNSTDSPPSSMEWDTVLPASILALLLLILWWGGVLLLDGMLAAELAYQQYETVALLYPDVFYPGLPGWILAHVQPFYLGFYLVAIGWMVALSAAIGAGATWYATRRGRSALATAAVFVIVLFVTVTGIEAIAMLLGSS